MGKNACIGLLMLLACSSVAHAHGRHQDWKAVERLGQGVPVEVKLEGDAQINACRVISADDSSLTCVREKDPDADWDAASGARLVFPRAAVQDIWFLDTGSRHLALWITIGVAVAIVIAASAEGNVVGGLYFGALILGGVGFWSTEAVPFPRSQPPPLRRRLVYHPSTP
jgi:hypothetical protein